MERMVSVVNRAASSNAFINVLLAGCFGALAFRSARQQREIEEMEVQKDNLVRSNKAIKTTIWNSKQQLYASADSNSQTALFLVPLSKLKAIYGEPTSSSTGGDAEKGDGKSPAPRIMI